MDRQRRIFLRGTMASSVVAVSLASGLLSPSRVLAAWPEAAFEAKDVMQGMEGLFGTGGFTESADITMRTPDIAEDGAVVPVTVTAKMPGVESISVFAVENVKPLAISANLGASARPVLATRIKLGKTSNLIAVVRANGKLYGTTKTVKVTLGGCGG